MKKTKIIVRVISCILVVIMLLGLIIPYVSAAEMSDAVNDEGVKPTISLDVPEEFDTSVVTVFVGNIDTYKVQCYHLYNNKDYAATLDLNDGYYVIYANDFAWSDSDGDTYAVNNGEYQYIYIGDNYDPKLYGVNFQTGDGNFKISLGRASSDMQVIKYNSSLMVTDGELVYPEDAKLIKLTDKKEPEQTENVDDSEQPNETNPIDQEQDDEGGLLAIWNLFVHAIQDSSLLLIAIAACFIGLSILKIKKKAKASKQAEEDKYDDRRIE